ncbi:LysR family transcriptional regulator [Mesorhizobium mediterraneum]|uniref:LysR family transcriptional regulator n=1 Tax=Mesorhizobium mediterraneum TaxID=43617 RepID=UPI001FEEB0FA|nr:LysR family transcriptional regulator [Mesorhizobium mediterraneum]
MIDWNDLRFFLAVASAGNTAAAGRQLGVNQSTVVRRITAMEEALRLRLFNRKRDGYRLTPEGEALLQEATAVEAAVQALTRRAAALDSAFTGSLRVTTAEGMALGLVPQLLNEFHRQYPGIRVHLLIEDRYNDLSDGQAEIALRAGPPGDGSLVGRKLSDQSWAIYGSGSYVERWGSPTTPHDLNVHRLIGFEGSIEDITPARWLRAVAPDCEIACRSNSVLGLLLAVQSGFGLALLPCQIGDAEADLVRVIDPQPGLTSGFWILTHPDLHKRPKIRAFFDFMVEEIAKHRALLLGQTRPSRASAEQPVMAGRTSSDAESPGSIRSVDADRLT